MYNLGIYINANTALWYFLADNKAEWKKMDQINSEHPAKD